jgi:hypothetical protein
MKGKTIRNTTATVGPAPTGNSGIIWGATIALAIVYFIYSRSADGFYQQDEAAHFLSMKGFWFNPNSVLGNWAKPGYKLIYAIPALLGSDFVMFFNSAIAALACFFAYKVAQKLGSNTPMLAFVLAASQPLWINLAFRNYSEIVSACLFTAAVWVHLEKRYTAASLLLSYVAFIRQEFYPFVGLYFLWLAYHKKWMPALLLGTFPLLQNIWGAVVSGDPLYLLNQILQSSEEIGSAYPRKGFEHYFLMSITIYGSAVVSLVVVYIAVLLSGKLARFSKSEILKNQELWVLLPVLLYFLMYCVFNIQSYPIGPSGGGNLRYLLVVSPLAAVLASLGQQHFRTAPRKTEVWIVLGVFIIAVAMFMSYKHNYIVFIEGRDWWPLAGVMLTVLLLVLPLQGHTLTTAFAGLLLFLTLVSVRPIKLSEEDKACARLAEWYMRFEQQNGERPLYLHHDMFYYYLGRTRYEFSTRPQAITDANMQAAPKGSIILWDSHYSYRPELRKESLDYKYFVEQRDKFRLIEEIVSSDQRFGVLVFEKL